MSKEEINRDKYIVKYKATGQLDESIWRYYKSFFISIFNNKTKIKNSSLKEKARKINFEEGERVVKKIKRLYDKAPEYYYLKEIELEVIEKYRRKVSRWELMDI